MNPILCLIPILTLPLLPAQESAAMPAAAPALLVLNKSVASASLIDLGTWSERAVFEVGTGPHEAATTPDGALAVVCNYGDRKPGSTLTVLDLRAGKVLRTIELRTEVTEDGESRTIELLRPHGVQFLPDARSVVVTSESSRNLVLVDVGAGRVVATIPTQQNGSHMVALTPDARRAYVANIGSGSMTAIDLVARKPLKVVPTGAQAEGIAVHPSRPEVWVTNRQANTLSIVDSEALEVVATLECGKFPIRAAFTPDGAHALVSCAADGVVEVYDVAARELAHRIAMTDEKAATPNDAEGRVFGGQFGSSPVPVGILISPDGRRAFVANTQTDMVTVLDLERWKVERRIRTRREPDGMAWVGPAR